LSAGSLSFNNNPFSGKYVMNLTSLTLTNHSVLTLNGAAGTAFVVNVSGAFSLTSNSQIVLSGGLTPSDVLFNVTGNTGAFSITGDSLLQGTLLAYNKNGTQRTLTLDGVNTLVRGQIIANKVIITGGAKVRKPPRASCDQDRNEQDREREND
jgi:choice-of-anchor A domain-containing protein